MKPSPPSLILSTKEQKKVREEYTVVHKPPRATRNIKKRGSANIQENSIEKSWETSCVYTYRLYVQENLHTSRLLCFSFCIAATRTRFSTSINAFCSARRVLYAHLYFCVHFDTAWHPLGFFFLSHSLFFFLQFLLFLFFSLLLFGYINTRITAANELFFENNSF